MATDATDPNDTAGATAAPATATRARARWRWLAVPLLLVLLLVGGLGSTLWWTLTRDAGTAWLVERLPGLRITGLRGALLADFDAERVDLLLPGVGNSLRLHGLGWRGLQVSRGSGGHSWLHLRIARLYAARVELLSTPSGEPTVAPTDLRLPVEIEIGELRVQALQLSGPNAQPVRDLLAAVHLGADGGREHRVDGLRLGYDRLAAQGTLRIGSDAPLNLAARVQLSQDAAVPAVPTPPPTAGASAPAAAASAPSPVPLDWSATASLTGPLAEPHLVATLRAQAGPTAAAQSLDLRATLRPFAAWPLGDLQASAQALDLQALHRAAPATALSGQALARSSALDQPAAVDIELSNALAGRWNEGRLPLRKIRVQVAGRPDQPGTLTLQALDASLGTVQVDAGRLTGQGRWTAAQWQLQAQLAQLLPAGLDARAPTMTLSGPVTLAASGLDATEPDSATLELQATLDGQLAKRGPARAVQLRLDARLNARQIELREARVAAGSAHATLSGQAQRLTTDADAWQLKGKAALVDFDPLPWWPGRDDSPLRKGPHRLNALGDFDLSLPLPTAQRPLRGAAWVAAWRGQLALTLSNSLLAGVPLSGSASLRAADGAQVTPRFTLDAAGNSLRAEGRIAARGNGADDRWDLNLAAPALARLAPLWHLAGAPADLAGSLNASAQLEGRWPALRTQGTASAQGLVAGAARAASAQARWSLGTQADAPLDAQLSIDQAAYGNATADTAQLMLQGSARAHRLELRAASKARPPAWTEALHPSATAPVTAVATAPATEGSVAVLLAQGGLVEGSDGAVTGWRGSVQQVDLRSSAANATPWFSSAGLSLEALWAGPAPRFTLQPGQAEVLGGRLRWSRVAWQGAGAGGSAAQLDVQAELEPLRVAPILQRLQPSFGWGGDLTIAGKIDVRSAPAFNADIVLERSSGDLTVTDEIATQALGLTDLRLGLNAADGVWSFTQALAGQTLGVAAGAVVARTTAQKTWPDADTPISGVLELQVANLGTWGTWVPAGWRLGGKLRTSATIAGRFGAPEYTGEVRGEGLSVRNFLQGVNVSDGDVAIALQGATARIDTFSAKAGNGTVRLDGSASLGETPQAALKLVAERFQVIGRVDRRIVASGSAELRLDRDTLALDGDFGVDEGLIDFSKGDAPSLSSDVTVVRAGGPAAPANGSAPAVPAKATNGTKVALNLRVTLGEKLRLRGRGLDTGLRGELRLTSPGGVATLNGSLSTHDGTYAAYGQKLTIDRGEVSFNGPIDNPRLNIEATRPNTDVRVGVQIGGTVQNLRIRLFSEPEMSEVDKLSWLVLGRASDGLGRTDTALLQRAALALLAGEGEGLTDQLTRAIGLDELSLRQTEGEVRETVISLGKQLSRRWYVGYERSLNATSGSWQLIYRVAQRFTLRAQSGEDNSLDVVWTWRWQ